jgi:hypothetical protein
MSVQNKIIDLFFARHERVKVLQEGKEITRGQIVCECNGRPGFYYVRTFEGELDLYLWSDLARIQNA